MKLSILICSLESRKHFLNNLLFILNQQKNPAVEILIESDSGETSIGAKRNKLLARSTGKYVCFVDDDDEVASNYVSLILTAIETDPDCCSLSGIMTTNGTDPRTFIHSLEYKSWYEADGIYYRNPNHLNAIRRSLAVQVGFPEINNGEDRDFSMRLLPLLKTESAIKDTLYFYKYVTNKKSLETYEPEENIKPSELDTSVTFIIPVNIDNQPKRTENLLANIRWLSKQFKHPIIVAEGSKESKLTFYGTHVIHNHYEMEVFNKSKLLNLSLREAKSSVVVCLDCDVFVDTKHLKKSIDSVYYNNCEISIPFTRNVLSACGDDRTRYMSLHTHLSVEYCLPLYTVKSPACGGILVLDREKALSIGGFNPNFTEWGWDTEEFVMRGINSGLRLHRCGTDMVHLEHENMETNPYNGMPGLWDKYKAIGNRSKVEYDRIESMNLDQILSEVSTWTNDENTFTQKTYCKSVGSRKIQILWPTVRPDLFRKAFTQWKSLAKYPESISITVAVNTEDQAKQLLDFNVIVVNPPYKGVCLPCYKLSSSVNDLQPDDIVILASDDFMPPENWDAVLFDRINSNEKLLIVDDGIQMRGSRVVTIPIMTYGALCKLNKVIYHPAYHHMCSDVELYDVAELSGIIDDARGNGFPVFEHLHHCVGKRVSDAADTAVESYHNTDKLMYANRSKMSLQSRLKVEVVW